MRQILNLLLCVSLFTVLTCLPFPRSLVAQELSIGEMAKLLPDSINSVMVVNAERIRTSPIAKREGWVDSSAGKVSSGLMFLPGNADVVLIGTVFDYDTFDPLRTAALVSMKKTPSVDMIRQVSDGYIDIIGDVEVVECPGDHFIVPLDDHLVASFQPALRPDFSRWLRALQTRKSSRVEDYLEEGLGYADELGTEVIVAFNLADVISRSQILERLGENELVSQNGLDPEDVARQIASIRGFTLGITVRDKIFGSIKYDFTEDVSSLSPLAKQLAMEICQRSGVHLDEFHDWNAESSAHQIKLSGEMSTESFRKILSLAKAPATHETDFVSQDETEYERYRNPVTATKQYFDSINSFVEQLSPKLGPGHAYTENANWLRRYADRIDDMPTLYIDEEMVAYGNYVSQVLRESSLMLINSRETSKQKNKQLLASGARSGGGWGGGSYGGRSSRYGVTRGYYGDSYSSGGDGSRLRSSARYKEKSEAIKAVAQAFTEIAVEQDKVRQAMTNKFEFEF